MEDERLEEAMTTTSTTTEKIRTAEETVARAREALETAESGLRTAEKMSAKADTLKSHPVMVWAIVLASVGLVTWLIKRGGQGAES